MASPLLMPDLGTVEGNVTLVRWLKAEGDTVSLGEPLFEAETDKGVSEVECALAGVLLKKVLAEGASAAAGETIAIIGAAGEAVEAEKAPVAGAGAAATQGQSSQPTSAEAPKNAPSVTPVIRALAEKWGVDLSSVTGSGPGGRITREDVLRVGKARAAGSPSESPQSRTPPPAAPQSLSRGQAAVARTVSRSSREKPVFHVQAVSDMSELIRLRGEQKARGVELAWDAFFVKAAASAIAEMPVFRRFIAGDVLSVDASFELKEHVRTDIAVAVGVEDELFVPAVRNPAERNVGEISRDIAEAARKAAARALLPSDIEDSCFLVSNLGMFPVESFDAIIYPDHCAAMSIGSTTPTPVSDGRKTWIAPLARLTLTVDHRLINGRTAARFLARVKEILEKGAFA